LFWNDLMKVQRNGIKLDNVQEVLTDHSNGRNLIALSLFQKIQLK
jgi:hypothetical protein